MPELVHEFDVHADITPDDIGRGPFGHRRIANVTGGDVRGERLRGELTGAGADWILRGPDGYGRVDVRLTVKTHDGAFIYVQYLGLLELTHGWTGRSSSPKGDWRRVARSTTASTGSPAPDRRERRACGTGGG